MNSVSSLTMQRFDEAANAFYEGVKLDPENKELVNAFRLHGNILLFPVDEYTAFSSRCFQLKFPVLVILILF